MSRYHYQKPVGRSIYSRLRLYSIILGAFIAIIAIISGVIIAGIRSKNLKPTSNVQSGQVSGGLNVFSNSVFQFSDYGQWVLDKRLSTPSHYIYEKYLGQELQGLLNVYVNSVPAEPNLTSTRVLPVRIVNNNSFQVTGVSDPCSNQFAAGQPHLVREFTINGATMLCDPSSGIYTVVVSQIQGNYQIPMMNSKNQPVQFVITYRNDEVSPQPASITNVVNSFKAL